MLLIGLLISAPAFAASGDYGVATGASSSSGCGGSGQPACTLNWSGYGLTYSHNYGAYYVYTFDDFDCTVYIHSTSGSTSGRGAECNQYQPNSS